jgi:short-subunit dehydrogenase involved in D-alanine esterification of teichoic acids
MDEIITENRLCKLVLNIDNHKVKDPMKIIEWIVDKVINIVWLISTNGIAVQYDVIQCSSMMWKYRVYFNISAKMQTLSHLINYLNNSVAGIPEKYIDNIFDRW